MLLLLITSPKLPVAFSHSLCLVCALLLARLLALDSRISDLIYGYQEAATNVARSSSCYSNRLHFIISNGSNVVMMETVIRLLVTEKRNAVSNGIYFNAVFPISVHKCNPLNCPRN